MISVSFFMFLWPIIEKNAPRGGVLARFYRLGDGGFELFFARGVGNLHSKIGKAATLKYNKG